GLEADALMELFYQRIMFCYLALGGPAEGLSVFRRMRQTLSVTLGTAPSRESEALSRQLMGGPALVSATKPSESRQ
ncbi:MAG TPA: bacterial transcriptional activator domain-containing protein, partial [Burkholderiales bacterium]|nr:bacterial transcriptional activator domain-containing protein [Burkholderiales bacterium]